MQSPYRPTNLILLHLKDTVNWISLSFQCLEEFQHDLYANFISSQGNSFPLTQDCYNTEWVFLSLSLLFLGPTQAPPISKAKLRQTTNKLTTNHSWTAYLNIFSFCLFLHTLNIHKLIIDPTIMDELPW